MVVPMPMGTFTLHHCLITPLFYVWYYISFRLFSFSILHFIHGTFCYWVLFHSTWLFYVFDTFIHHILFYICCLYRLFVFIPFLHTFYLLFWFCSLLIRAFHPLFTILLLHLPLLHYDPWYTVFDISLIFVTCSVHFIDFLYWWYILYIYFACYSYTIYLLILFIPFMMI